MVAEHQQQNIPSQPQGKIARLVTIFAMLGAPVAWAVHFNVMYFLVQPVCRLGGEFWFHGTTVVMLLVCIAAGVAAWRHHSGNGGLAAILDGKGNWKSFVALFGVAAAVLFAYAIIYQWSPVLTFGACDAMGPPS